MTRASSDAGRAGPIEVVRKLLTPGRAGTAGGLAPPAPGATAFSISVGDDDLAAWAWGPAGQPTVLLVHGWGADRRDMAAFVSPLLSRGLRVVAIDLPAHGRSAGDQASIPDLADGVAAAARAVGPLRGIVAHSVGAAASALALADRDTQPKADAFAVERLVLPASPARYADHVRASARHAGLSAEEEALMQVELAARGVDVARIDLPAVQARVLRRQALRALVVHSTDDRVVAVEAARATEAVWPEATFVELQGLSHRGLLFDPGVIARTAAFLTE